MSNGTSILVLIEQLTVRKKEYEQEMELVKNKSLETFALLSLYVAEIEYCIRELCDLLERGVK